MNYQKKLEDILDSIKDNTTPKLLLHACCAPCSSYVIEYLSNYFDITIYFYNPNIDTKEEFNRRSDEIEKFLASFKTKNKVNYIIEDYNNKEFELAIKDHEDLKEGSKRCFLCYGLRLRKTALYAKKNKYDYFTTTLSISPYKNSNKLNEIGEDLQKELNISYLYGDFKKKNGYKRSIELSSEYGLYRQDYCGCKYSKKEKELRDSNKNSNLEVLEKKEESVRDLSYLYEASYNKTIVKNKKKDKDDEMFRFHDIRKKDVSRHNNLSIFGKIITLLMVLALFFIIFISFYEKPTTKVKTVAKIMEYENIKASLEEYYIYGNHLNIKGSLEIDSMDVSDINLVFKSDEDKLVYDLNYNYSTNKYNYYITDILNEGILIDDININNYSLYIEVVKSDNKYKYELINNTNYDETIYYGISKGISSNKYVFKTDKDTSSINLKVTKEVDDVYDIVIDPGHGGLDSGACKDSSKLICETNYNLELSKLLKNELEEAGFKVYLTRTKDLYLEKYGDTGRVTTSYESNAKLLISVHLNSGDKIYSGFEVYTPYKANYNFARKLVGNLNEYGKLTYSDNIYKKVENGIYTRTFDNNDLNNIIEDAKEKEYEAYSVSLLTNYYFMIRETGGYMTGAYIDGRDGDDENKFVLSNRGIESYILELGYINNENDLKIIDEHKKDYMKIVSDTIKEYYNK